MEDCIGLETPVTLPKVVTKYRYELRDWIPHVEVGFQVWCYSAMGELLHCFSGKIEGAEYVQWGTDDVYIDEVIKGKVLAKLATLKC